uniref:Uncharacterized protein n=1 Tax=Lepidodinium chlorophorum TaxID=107758 RepID=A0A0F7R640_LEPCH|nr:hypothetical protein [Lepidodinium chlorophorum]BAR72342.1 hypothetical protein [Lepidodinium chlorophorum]
MTFTLKKIFITCMLKLIVVITIVIKVLALAVFITAFPFFIDSIAERWNISWNWEKLESGFLSDWPTEIGSNDCCCEEERRNGRAA